MEDLRTRAQLVSSDHAGAIGTVVTRAEIAEAAAGTAFPATFLLDLDRVEPDAGEVTAHARVAVEWDRETLEQLLAATPEEAIELRFNERELARAFDENDVEGHGLRTRAAVIAVAVAAAGASAAPSFASVASVGGGGAGGGTHVVATGGGAGGGTHQAVGGGGAASGTHQAVGGGGAASGTHANAGGGAAPHAQATPSSDGSALSSGELAGVVAGGALLISAAGFGAARKRTPPVLPA